MGWQDDPVVEQAAWSKDPVVGDVPPHNSPVHDQVINRLPSGRILDAFGQGFHDAFGSQPILSAETESAMQNARVDKSILGAPRRAFNEVFFRPAATMLAGGMRAAAAFPAGVGRAVGEVMNETGVTKLVGSTEEKSLRDWQEMGSITPMALGVAENMGVIARPANASRKATVADEGSPPAGPGEAAAPTIAAPTKTMASNEGLEPQPHTLFQDQPENPAGNKAGNINLDRIQAPNDVKDVIRKTAADNGGFMESRRGEMSLTETEQLADAMGMTPESLNTRKIGAAFNAEQVTAARTLLVDSATKLRDIAANVKDGDEASLQAYVEAEAKHKSIQEQVAGLTAEGGRALNAFKINARAVGEAKDFSQVLEGLGDSAEGAAARARAIGELDTPAKVSAFINSTRRPSFKDRFLEYWINGLLSGPATHTTYAESNALLALWKGGVETPVAGAIGAARQAAMGKGIDRVFMGETGAQMHGYLQGAAEGIPAAWRAMKAGVTEALPGEKARVPLVPKIPGMAGQIITVPSRVIAGIHTFGRSMGYRMELNTQAYRAAAKAGLEGDAFATKLAQLKAEPTDKMMDAAVDASTRGTMMAQPDASSFGAKLESLANANVLTKMVAPFVRVGLNIIDQGLVKRTPIGLMSQDVRDTLLGAHGEAARDIQIARMGVGSALGATAVHLAAQGLLTGGGPSEPRAAAVWRLTGRQPYSAKLFGVWYGYHRLGSLGQIIGVAADMHEIGEHLDSGDAASVATLLTNAVAKNLVDETWMRGPSDLIEALRDPDRYGKSYIRNQLATLVPFSVGMGQVARSIDPDVRNAQNIIDAVKVKIPFLSQTVRPRYDIWGHEMENQGNLGPDALGAIAESRVNNDPVNQELLELGISPSAPEKKIKGVTLEPDQYDEFQRTAGRLAKTQLDGLVGSEGWMTMPAFARKEIVERTIRDSRQTAAGLMQMRHPELIQQGMQNRIDQIRGVKK